MSRQILVTCALPYANGPIHLGHMLEHIQADVWVRFHKMRGHDVIFLCADDTHGTPIMIEAKKRGITPEELIAKVSIDHQKDFADFSIGFDHYSSTHSPANRELCSHFFSKMQSKGHLKEQSIEQLYCDHDKMFLPDRFVKGTCPKCGAPGQNGDSCDVCGATYNPTDLKNPACSLCGTTPVLKPSQQLMFKVNDHRDFLQAWIQKHLQREMSNKLMDWFQEPLRDWDISRQAPYFGFEIPGHPGKFFYVWVDAPMGYVSATKEYCEKTGRDFASYWVEGAAKSEVYHFIGKDITYFHALFWPALLKTADFRTPSFIPVHGHVTLNGERMSKSKGTFVAARTYLNHLDPECLRYYYAAKLSDSVDDLDWNLDDFVKRVNSDLVGKIVNLASRGAQMLGKRFSGEMSSSLDVSGEKLVSNFKAASETVAGYFESREYVKALTLIRELADEANRYFDEQEPWKKVETDPDLTQQVLTSTLNAFRILAVYLTPVLPNLSEKVRSLFQESRPYTWGDSQKTLLGKKISAYSMLAVRLDPERIKAMMDESASLTKSATAQNAAQPSAQAPLSTSTANSTFSSTESATISIDDFSKVDLRIARIISAEAIPEADKLLRLKVDLGPLGEKQIFAGIKAAYDPATLVNRLTIVVANLAPRKMKFGMSEGMVLAAGAGGKELFIMSPDTGAKPGDKVK